MNKDIPKIIHQIWFQGEENIPEKYHSMRESWKKYHPTWKHILWDKEKIEELLVEYENIKPLYEYFTRMIAKIDLAKLVIMHRYGGVYSDMDMTALRPIDELLTDELVFSELNLGDTEGFSFQLWGGTMGKCHRGKAYNNAFFASIPKHDFWLKLLKSIDENKKHHWYQPSTLYMLNSTGPMLLTYLLQTNPPKRWKSYPPTTLESPTPTKDSYALHGFANTWASPTENLLTYLYNPWVILLIIIALAFFFCLR